VLDDQAIAAEQEGEIDVDGRRRRVVGSRSSGSSIHVCWMWLALCDKRVADKSRIDLFHELGPSAEIHVAFASFDGQ
jgi:hypothetical protein